jgi:DNA-binding transcriptional LysR family regulator
VAQAELGHRITLSASAASEALDPVRSVASRDGIGGPASSSVRRMIEAATVEIAGEKARLAERRERLDAHDCIRARLPSGAIMRWDLPKSGEQTLVEVGSRLIVGTTELAVTAAVAGAGIAYVEAREAQWYVDSGELVPLLADWTPPFPGMALYYPRQRHPSAAFRAFIDFFKAHSAGRSVNGS